MGDLISRTGVSSWLDNMGYTKLANAVMGENRFPSQDQSRDCMWVCPNCGLNVHVDYDRCVRCGAKMLREDGEA